MRKQKLNLKAKYGAGWPVEVSDFQIELACIAKGGSWIDSRGETCGLGLFEHYMNARRLAWPDRYRHHWTDLMYHNFIENDVTILMGAASTQKTSHAVEYALMSYLAKPDNTLVILSTTTMDKLDIGVWAELTMLWQNARNLHPWIPGHIVQYKRAITTDNMDEDEIRIFRKGVICRPCIVGNRFVGLGTLAGVKQDNIIYVCDELQFMSEGFSGSWPHLFSNSNVKIIGSGNPKHDPEDQLSLTAEPLEGWANHPEPTTTEVWPTKFMGGKCVNLYGPDSDNFKVKPGKPEPYPRLIGPKFAARIAHDSGPNSFDYYRLILGVMKVGFALSRVITRQICRDNHALEGVVWADDKQTRLYALDPTYGGEDRCIGMEMKFGYDTSGKEILDIAPYDVFRIDLSLTNAKTGELVSPEDQIANTLAVKLGETKMPDGSHTYVIPPENVGYDATGKGTIGAAFARRFGRRVPTAIDSGAQPTERAVRADLYTEDKTTGQQRLKTCREHYSKFVSEMWFSARYTAEAGQMRGLLEDVMAEGCARIYNLVSGDKIEVEPKKKEDLKRRLGKSPDLFDCLAIGVEKARQLGFTIGRLGQDVVDVQKQEEDWFETERKLEEDAIKAGLLERVK
jgi:hypothetical protein